MATVSDRNLVPLDLGSLRARYVAKALSPTDVIAAVLEGMLGPGTEGIWIDGGVLRERALEAARRLEKRDPASLPLYGVPFAVKDNIDVEGITTTAACPAFAYIARRSSPLVARLLDAGAVLVGKTNLDQFATGLVGTRSPYGVPQNPFDARYITGGSSSGSAAAVARGLVSFALGTDTAGSGRVPAAFNNIVGLKPSRGLLSTSGVVPACRSLDCVSIFALTCDDARRIAEVATAFDPSDPYSREAADGYTWEAPPWPARFSFGVPRDEDLVPLVDQETLRSFEAARAHLEALGGRARTIDLRPFFEAATLLYDGPWLAERLEGLESFLSTNAEHVLPITRQIVNRGASFRATETFTALHHLEALQRTVHLLWNDIEVLLLPTAPTIPKIDEVAADPIALNARLGTYTNFVNLLDLAGIAIPAERRTDGLPQGVTLLGPWGADAKLLRLAASFHQRTSRTLGATGWPLPASGPSESEGPARASSARAKAGAIRVAVVGAHLSGQPLNHQLTDLGARFVATVRTAPRYHLFALPLTPPKPGMLRVADGEPGFSIETEVWEIPLAEFGVFFAQIAFPLCMGTVELENGDRVSGFLCESSATTGAPDISSLGGWRNYLGSRGTK